jgi:hypothetical protein
MSVFQNPHMAGRTGFGSSGGYRQPRGGMMTKDQYGDSVRQLMRAPANAMSMGQSRGQQPFSRGQQAAGQDFSAYSQPMAPSRQTAPAALPQGPYQQQPQMPSRPVQQSPMPSSPPSFVGGQSQGEGRTMSNQDYAKKSASFGPSDGTPWTEQQIWEQAQWSQKNARAMI